MEQRKVLLIIVSITVILAATIGVGLLLFYPRDEVPESTAETDFWDPMDFLAGSGARPGFGDPDSGTADSDLSEGTETAPTDAAEMSDDGSFSVTYGVREGFRPSGETSPDTAGSRVGSSSVTIREEEESQERVSSVSRTEPPVESTTPEPSAPRPDASRPAREGSPSASSAGTAAASTPQVTEEATLASRAYWVQVISSPNRDTIEQAQRSLADHQLLTRVLTKEIGGTVYYRLRLGPFAVREEAEKFLDWVLDLDRFADALIFVDYTTSVRAPSGS